MTYCATMVFVGTIKSKATVIKLCLHSPSEQYIFFPLKTTICPQESPKHPLYSYYKLCTRPVSLTCAIGETQKFLIQQTSHPAVVSPRCCEATLETKQREHLITQRKLEKRETEQFSNCQFTSTSSISTLNPYLSCKQKLLPYWCT